MNGANGVDREFVGLPSPTMPRASHGSHPCQGLYWKPRGARPRIAFIATHYNGDFSERYLAEYLAKRGFGFLGWNTRFRGAEDMFLLGSALIDVGVGVRWLYEQAGAEAVVVLGNSGGGSLMGAYQSQALAVDISAPGRDTEALAARRAADLYGSVNSHPGRPDVITKWLDPSVTDETDPTATDPALDAFDPSNGPPYSAEFIARYRLAQVERNHRITRWAQRELERLAKSNVPDRIFPLFRCWADLRFMDPTIDPSDRKCPACYSGDPARANRGPFGLGRANTLRTWLSMWSLEHSEARAELHLPKIREPALVVQSMADTGVFPSDAKILYQLLGSEDKQLELIPGAHYFETDLRDREHVADLIAGWIRQRTD